MANRRMFSKEIIDSDAFLDMALSTQALYFHLSMRADDDGFVNNPKKIARMIGSGDDEFKILLAKNFIIGFDSGIIVIKHWKIHNYIQKDRYKESNYIEEKKLLGVKENGIYTLDTDCIQIVDSGKVSKELVEDSKDNIVDVETVDHKDLLAKRTIDYLNHKNNKKFGYTLGNLKEIKSQINKLVKSGDTFETIENKFAFVIDVKTAEWINNIEMKKYINPTTLFRESNFDKYLNQDVVFDNYSFIDKLCGE